MTIDEAIEIVRNERTVSIETARGAMATLAQAYLDENDPTPLTVELIEREIGASIDIDDHFWITETSHIDWVYFGMYARYCGIKLTTLGDLRQIVAMLRREK